MFTKRLNFIINIYYKNIARVSKMSVFLIDRLLLCLMPVSMLCRL